MDRRKLHKCEHLAQKTLPLVANQAFYMNFPLQSKLFLNQIFRHQCLIAQNYQDFQNLRLHHNQILHQIFQLELASFLKAQAQKFLHQNLDSFQLNLKLSQFRQKPLFQKLAHSGHLVQHKLPHSTQTGLNQQ